jgi:hypothetical protein
MHCSKRIHTSQFRCLRKQIGFDSFRVRAFILDEIETSQAPEALPWIGSL